jgi:hypothetical protein
MRTRFMSSAIHRRLAIAAAALAGWIAMESRAHACTYVPILPELAAEQVPLAGPVLIDLNCTETDFCESGEPALVITRDGEPVEGTVELLRGDGQLFLIWTPAASLTAGEAYRVTLVDVPDWGTSLEFEVRADPDVEWTAPALDTLVWSRGATAQPVGEPICCVGGFSCFGTCLAEREVLRATVALDQEAAPSTPAFVYRMRWREADGSESAHGWRRSHHWKSIEATFQQLASSYCATLEVRSLIDGTVMQAEHCEDPDPALAYGEIKDAIHAPDRFLFGDCPVPPGADETCDPTRDACSVPSRPLLEGWCAAWQPRCAAPDAVFDTCALVSGYCETTPDHDTGTSRSDDAGADDDEATGGYSQAQAGSADGCSAAGGRLAAPQAAWVLGSLLLPLLRSRRRTRRLTA